MMNRENPTNPPQPAAAARLRQRALARVNPQTADVAHRSPDEIQALVYELQVHQAELEIQNEELRDAQLELADARDRYLDLYEFAPVGYLTLDGGGTIHEANLTAAVLLGTERGRLLGRRVEEFVAPDGRDACYLYLRAAMDGEAVAPCEVLIPRRDGTTIFLQLNLVPVGTGVGAAAAYRVALTDITQRKQADAERERLVAELRAALATVKTLRSLLPICSHCHRVRDDAGYWEALEVYVSKHTDTQFTHGLCPTCLRELYPEFAHDQDGQEYS